MKKRALSMMIALAMVVALVPNLILTAGAADSYSLWVGGEQFTSEKLTVYDGNGGTAVYDPDTTTLTLNNYNYSGAGYSFTDDSGLVYAAIYYGGSDEFTLVMNGNNSVTCTAAGYASSSTGIYSIGFIRIQGNGSLTARGSGSTCSYGLIAFDSIDILGGTVTAIGDDSDFESAGIMCSRSSSNRTITIENDSVVTAIAGDAENSYGICSSYCYIYGGTVTVSGARAFYLLRPISVDFDDAICFYGDTQEAAESNGERDTAHIAASASSSNWAYIRVQKSTVPIPLRVGDEQISYDKLTVYGGNGTAVYDPQTNTLTLNNYTYEGPADAGIRYMDGTKTLKLVLNGSNTINLNKYLSYSTYGVYSKGGLDISGDGSLTADASNAGNHSHGIYAEKDITISGGTVTAIGGNIKTVESKTSYGLCSKNGSITISGGTVNATGGDTTYKSYGIYAYQDITISGGTVNATGGVCYIESFGIYAKQNVTVSGGTVTATGGYCDDNRLYSIGINSSKIVTISGGTVTVSGTANNYGYGIYAFTSQRIIISGGTLIASASKQALKIAPDTSDYVGSCYYGDSQSAAESAGAKPIGDLADNHGKMYVMMKDSRPTVTIANGIKNGTATADKAVCMEGGTVTLTAVPNAGYLLDSWNVTDAGGTTVSVTESNQFTMPASSVTVSAVFKACDHSSAVYTDNEDGTHSITCAACGVNESEDHSGGTATCSKQAECKHCGASYGIVDKTNHDKTVAYSNGFCEYGCYEPAELVDGYYQIKNAGQLFWFAKYINTVDRTASAVLTADIDLENRPWTPIGFTNESSNNFRGVFDGQNHTIKGLYVVGGRAGLGFFGEVRTGTVKNFTIYGEVIVNTEVNYVGGVIGSACGLNGSNHGLEHNGATIQNITSYVNLTAKTHGIGMIGGFVGYANHQSLIENCSWYGTFDAGKYRVDSGAGGFIGKIQENTSEVTIRNCAAYGTIKTNYEKNSFNNTPTIYMGGFLSFSNTNAQTTLENCLFAGKFERGENLTDEAFLGAFGTLRSVKAIKNCYYLGDDGLEAVHSDSNLKPGSENVKITSVTGARLKSGEVAYKLGEHFGQILEGENRQSYPVLGGEAVYQVLNCKNETAYSNTNQNLDHNWENGFCAHCDGYEPAVLNGDVYEISNAGQLYWFSALFNVGNTETDGENMEINGVLTDNIVINQNVLTADGKLNGDGSNFRVWTPIGNGLNTYAGTFDGAGFTVSGMYFNNSETSFVGLFGYVYGGTVKNVGVVDSYLSGNVNVGGVVGYHWYGTITGCYNTGSVIASDGNVGGVAGHTQTGTVQNCYNTGIVSGNEDVGGVVGYNCGSTMQNCYNTGTVSGVIDVGGVAGQNMTTVYHGNTYYGTVTGCYNTGAVSGDENVGGVIGYNYNSSATVTNSYYDSTVYSGSAIGADNGTSTNVQGKTTEQFASGEVAYLLQSNQTEQVWGQDIGTDDYPVLGGEAVYQVLNCKNETAYSNTNGNIGHVYVGGVCTVCGASKPIDLGDVDCNGEVTNADLLLIYQYIYDPETSSINAEIADVSGDGKVTNADVLRILRYIFNSELYPLN